MGVLYLVIVNPFSGETPSRAGRPENPDLSHFLARVKPHESISSYTYNILRSTTKYIYIYIYTHTCNTPALTIMLHPHLYFGCPYVRPMSLFIRCNSAATAASRDTFMSALLCGGGGDDDDDGDGDDDVDGDDDGDGDGDGEDVVVEPSVRDCDGREGCGGGVGEAA